ncbi:hypothetical protein CRI93_11690 [Longimonas halophila]|uniref:POTRA domain-containing protein n=1 Tax=Longimonas halophila TaxID=1469170 RepID=A0A2H3NVG9_9BACT|nr:FtsQ-type POTRA domain-containing protein [Longimonas halophila]PEN05760.1 hypothetical protein CRI93_11690 [Longimonas halophila]
MKLSVRHLLRDNASRPATAATGVVALAVLVLVGALAWRWAAGGTVSAVHVSGHTVLSADSVRTLADLQTGQPLRTVEPERTAGRLNKHPWIAESTVRPRPFRNRVDIKIQERTPYGRWVTPRGSPRFFLDANGHALPARSDTTFDVPLVYDDSVSYHTTEPVVRPATQQMLRALATADTARALISGFRTDPDHAVDLYVTHPEGYTMTVHMGHTRYSNKLQRLKAFHTHVLPYTDGPIRTIDLRFEEQVITQP